VKCIAALAAGIFILFAPIARAAEQPRLILFLVIDQGRADYLDRYRPMFHFGLDRLLRESVRFTEAYHDHAIPKTAPGHATLASGTHPRRHGIIANSWIDPRTDKEIEAVEDPVDKVSPRLLLVPTIGDWMKAAQPKTKVYSVSGKDRAAALLGGHRADGAFWFDTETGKFTSSKYYRDGKLSDVGDPSIRTGDRYFGRLWEPVISFEALRAAGTTPVERGFFARTFPHEIGKADLVPNEDFWEPLSDSPFIDEMVADIAKALIVARGIGADDVTDLLAISFSGVDGVGHDYGPDSPEMLDTLLRLDRVLGQLFDFIDQRTGLARTIISISADHGVTPLPGALRAAGLDARSQAGDDVACIQRAGRAVTEPGLFHPGPRFDDATIKRLGLNRAELEMKARRALEACPRVARVWTRTELSGEPPAEKYGQLFSHAFNLERSPDLIIQLPPHSIGWTSWNTTHSSVYEYDRHVPWLLRLPDGVARTIDIPVRTIDVAPTIAAYAGITVTGTIDGKSLAEIIDKSPKRSD
jgi:arylsulfatase A-like enzyme